MTSKSFTTEEKAKKTVNMKQPIKERNHANSISVKKNKIAVIRAINKREMLWPLCKYSEIRLSRSLSSTTNFGGPIKKALKAIARQILQSITKYKLAIIILYIFLQKDVFDFSSEDPDNKIIEIVIGMKMVNASILIKVAKNPSNRSITAYVIHVDVKISVTRRF